MARKKATSLRGVRPSGAIELASFTLQRSGACKARPSLFAGLESDFFRNRLTHSLEVAQIAKTIALKLNAELRESGLQLDGDLVEFAGLAHDLGHPPFGHTGEAVLDREMRHSGGFEGNAQTLRILCRLEKKLDDLGTQLDEAERPIWYRDGEDAAVGLNLCSRTIASILKYDLAIPFQRKRTDGQCPKGYYLSEQSVVERIKRDLKVDGSEPLRVIECQIMDLADDIAYSTYDLEDAYKGGLLFPLDVLYPDDKVAEEVAGRVASELAENVGVTDVHDVLKFLFAFYPPQQPPTPDWEDWYLAEVGRTYKDAKNAASIGFYRTALTSALVNHFVHAVAVQVNQRHPALSRVTMMPDVRIRVSVLKQLTYVLLINSPRLRLVAHRGETVVRSIFRALSKKNGHLLLPPDYFQRYDQAHAAQRPRVICDFIAGMTDRYAAEFYARLSSDVFTTMFKPL